VGSLEGKAAIVTGAGQGIGQGIALALAAAGASVAVVGRTGSKLGATCKLVDERGGVAIPITCDVTSIEQVTSCIEQTAAQLGGVNILVNNAQSYPYGNLLDVTEEAADEAWRSGPLATWRFMRLAHPYLRGDGVIVNMSSSTTIMHDGGFYGMYSAVKSAIAALTRAAAVEWGPDAIRALVVMPASESPALENFERERPERYAEMLSRIPLRRFGHPELDIGRAVAWACGPDARYITGSTLMLDGGQMLLR
jgi:meso-butanediol dehydrogenase / (S,S)-butanediol dehydrogenase / diacetyl reductase